MASDMTALRFAVLLTVLLGSCDLYGKQHVIFDSATEATPAEAGSADPALLERIFELENRLGELDRAIGDGLDDDGELAAKRDEIAVALTGLRRDAGDAYTVARRERLDRLRELEVK